VVAALIEDVLTNLDAVLLRRLIEGARNDKANKDRDADAHAR
jgi:hypothetical protein